MTSREGDAAARGRRERRERKAANMSSDSRGVPSGNSVPDEA
jgi:hypothetical protein